MVVAVVVADAVLEVRSVSGYNSRRTCAMKRCVLAMRLIARTMQSDERSQNRQQDRTMTSRARCVR